MCASGLFSYHCHCPHYEGRVKFQYIMSKQLCDTSWIDSSWTDTLQMEKMVDCTQSKKNLVSLLFANTKFYFCKSLYLSSKVYAISSSIHAQKVWLWFPRLSFKEQIRTKLKPWHL